MIDPFKSLGYGYLAYFRSKDFLMKLFIPIALIGVAMMVSYNLLNNSNHFLYVATPAYTLSIVTAPRSEEFCVQKFTYIDEKREFACY